MIVIIYFFQDLLFCPDFTVASARKSGPVSYYFFVSCEIVVISFEHLFRLLITFFIVTMLLLIISLWLYLLQADYLSLIRDSWRNIKFFNVKTFWVLKVYPNWVVLSQIIFVRTSLNVIENLCSLLYDQQSITLRKQTLWLPWVWD